MKALTLWQPWATAIALGAKRIETRSWGTSYRGPLAIHAAKKLDKEELIYLSCCWNWCGALGLRMGAERQPLWELLPFGAIVATCTLLDCRPTGSFTQAELDEARRPPGETATTYDWTERQMGNFELGCFGWILGDIRPITPAIIMPGARGLWDWNP